MFELRWDFAHLSQIHRPYLILLKKVQITGTYMYMYLRQEKVKFVNS